MNLMIEYAKSFLGVPYRYGGSTPMGGIDCSGLIVEIFKAFGVIPGLQDISADGLYRHFLNNGMTSGVGAGALCFYGTATNVTHVALMLNNWLIIEAGGGNAMTLSLAAAIDQEAFVRIRPYSHRKDLVTIIRPNYPVWMNKE